MATTGLYQLTALSPFAKVPAQVKGVNPDRSRHPPRPAPELEFLKIRFSENAAARIY
jgi:hypothetical protein